MAILCAFLAVACIFDYGRGKIPNPLVLLAALVGAGKGYYDTGPMGMFRFLLGMCGVMILMYPFFRIGMLGAGDVKLLGVASGYFPARQVLIFLFFSMLIAAAVSIFHVIRERNARDRVHYFCEYCIDVVRTGNWKLYFSEKGRIFSGVCLSGPIFCSALMHWGGVY